MARNTVGARELKTHLGKHLRRVRAGETLVITDRGEPIAEIRPIQDDLERKLAKLRALGRISGRGVGLPPFTPIHAPGVSLSEAVLEDREERF